MMLALIRPDSWNLPLFLHVLGATVLFGTVATVAIAGFATRTHAQHTQLLARVAQRTFMLGIVPAYILMRAGGAMDRQQASSRTGTSQAGSASAS